MTQQEMADLCGVGRVKVHRWEKKGLFRGADAFDLDGVEVSKDTYKVALGYVMQWVRGYVPMAQAIKSLGHVKEAFKVRSKGHGLWVLLHETPTDIYFDVFTGDPALVKVVGILPLVGHQLLILDMVAFTKRLQAESGGKKRGVSEVFDALLVKRVA